MEEERSACLYSGEAADHREFEESGENEACAGAHPDVDGLDVGDRRKIGLDARPLRGDCEQRGHTQGRPGGDGFHVEPEGDPRDDHD